MKPLSTARRALAFVGALSAALALSTATASAAPTAHLFAGWTSWGLMHSDQATISVLSSAPGDVEYAWVMADNDACQFTQIGWMWDTRVGAPVGGPAVFAYTQFCDKPAVWFYGPALAPGSSLTVRVVRTGTTYTDEYLAATGWITTLSDNLPWAPEWDVQVESYGPMSPVCFGARGCKP